MRCFLVGLGKIKILAKRGTPVVRDAIRLLRAHCLALDTGAVRGDNPYAFTFNCPHLSHRLPPAAVLPHHWRIRHYMTGS